MSKSARDNFTEGQIIEVIYPFRHSTRLHYEPDEEGGRELEVPCWKPGTERGDDGWGDQYSSADKEGKMLLTVVSFHKPGKYPERVFYTRKFVDPDGVLFGKSQLRMTTSQAFGRMASGFRHEYELTDEPLVLKAAE